MRGWGLGVWVAALLGTSGAPSQSRDVILATTTSTRDAGLLDTLVPLFERQTGYRVKVIAVGSGQALEMGRRGDADVVLAHAPEAERVLADSGYFVSRGDRSGTHQMDLKLWRAAAIQPPAAGSWYVEAGHGMGETLQMADEKRAYTLTDRATYLAWRDRLQLVPMVEGDPLLYNVYHVLELNPRNAPRINVAGGKAFADFMVAPATQALIGEFGKARFGQSLFIPDAGKPDRW